MDLRSSQGDFSLACDECIANDYFETVLQYEPIPMPGEGFWFLVRAETEEGSGTYDSGGASQLEGRDAEIAASGLDCLQQATGACVLPDETCIVVTELFCIEFYNGTYQGDDTQCP